MIETLFFLLLPLAAASGWWACLRWIRGQRRRREGARQSRYFQGLNYLLHEQPDKALEHFQTLASDALPSLDLQLAVGSLFRRRGEIDKAVAVHQALLSRDGLTRHQRGQILDELGEDYMSAGLLDRAERLFAQRIEQSEPSPLAHVQLLKIYQQEQEWEKAIRVARGLQGRYAQDRRTELGHFHCELAEQTRRSDSPERAGEWLERALQADPGCARAHCIRGELRSSHGDYRRAIVAYLSALELRPDLASVIVPALSRQYGELSDPSGLRRQLEAVYARHADTSIALALVECIQQTEGNRAARERLQQHLQQRLSGRGLRRLMALEADETPSACSALPSRQLNEQLLRQLETQQPSYRCGQCGYSTRSYVWLCPSCHQWNRLHAIQGLLGE
jgi:lipopolysaccharide biosynthesis regulator YciM